jgi:hypothetical protein
MKIPGAKFVQYYLKHCGGGMLATKIPEEMKLVIFVAGACPSHEHRMNTAMSNFFFMEK